MSTKKLFSRFRRSALITSPLNPFSSQHKDDHTLSSSSGARAERLAEKHLNQHGFKTIARNYQCRLGEIDLIVSDQKTLIFVEVRLRRNTYYGTPADTVTRHKQRKIIKAAKHFLMSRDTHCVCRFDVIELYPQSRAQSLDAGANTGESEMTALTLNWIAGAFYADD